MAKLQTLKGFRDFLPAEKRERDYVKNKIVEVFELYGFAPVESPTLEYASLLLGKYGQEADRLVYTFKDRGGREVGLRYDQTVPTARLLTQYQNRLSKYWRRYQIQNVFRADKPQRGRFREFSQCDIDIFGTTSPIADAEIIACTYQSFLNVGFSSPRLKLNDRKTLIDRLTPFTTAAVDVFSLIQSIDKLDKQPPEKVVAELIKKGLTQTKSQSVLSAISLIKPSEDLTQIMHLAKKLGVPKESLVFSPSLARGLDYYTGMIFEVDLPDSQVGSLGGGGRYDQLIGQLSGGTNIPAVGVAFGFDRMVETASKLSLIPKELTPTLLVALFSPETTANSLKLATQLRQTNISCELYPEATKLAKQLKYANRYHYPAVLILGPEEIERGELKLKLMKSGEEKIIKLNNLEAIKRYL